MYATLSGRWLSGTAVLLGHFGQEWNHTNNNAHETSPVNLAKNLICWAMNGDSYINNNVPFFADKGSYDDGIMEEIVNKRTEVKESPATEYDNEDGDQWYLIMHPDAVLTSSTYSRAYANFKQTTLDSFSFVGLASLGQRERVFHTIHGNYRSLFYAHEIN